jgi:hypothetical protein
MKLLPIIILVINCSLSYSQSVKKIFKEIKNENYEKAYKELSKTNADEKYSPQDVILLQIANCILLSNESYIAYNPYESNDLFIPLKENASVEVNAFLNKYELSIIQVEDIILKAIFNDSKTKNTIEAIDKAISYCKSCQYINELIELKLVAEYNETIRINSIEYFESFIVKYPNSRYTVEINELLCKKAFDDAVKINTINALNKYIKKYANCSLSKNAIEIRDSIAFIKLDNTYESNLNYTKQYPDSKYKNKIIQNLPNLLYDEAIEKKSIESLNLFVKEYPNDLRINTINKNLELAYYERLRNSFNIKEFLSFKLKFPSSNYLTELKQNYEKIIANNSLKREGLKGNVKTIKMIEEEGGIIRNYNELGNILTTSYFKNNHYSYIYDILEDTKLFVPPFNYEDEIHFHSGKTELIYNYDNYGKLNSISDIIFKYNDEGKLIEKLWGDIVIKYKWQNNKLIAKNIYKANGDIYYYYTIDYIENKKIIKEYEGHHRYNEPDKIYTLEYDDSGKLIFHKLVSYANYSNAWGFDEHRDFSEYYEYSNTNLLISKTKEHWDNSYPKYVTSKQRFHYDSHNNILYIETDAFLRNNYRHDIEWKYEYDSYGNWIKRTEYDVKIGDIKITTKKREINREITYY